MDAAATKNPTTDANAGFRLPLQPAHIIIYSIFHFQNEPRFTLAARTERRIHQCVFSNIYLLPGIPIPVYRKAASHF